jgi:hypothetical protein
MRRLRTDSQARPYGIPSRDETRVRDARPEGRDAAATWGIVAAVARRRWAQFYRALRRAQPGPERSGGTRPNP